jgi:hypothetical protein
MPGLNENVPTAKSFANAVIKFAGPWAAWDRKSHDLFTFNTDDGRTLYGEYLMLFEPNGNDYNLEFCAFGFLNKNHFGNPDPAVRQHFTAEEARAIENQLRAFAYDPTTFPKKYPPPGGFLDGLRFRPGWITLHPSEPR